MNLITSHLWRRIIGPIREPLLNKYSWMRGRLPAKDQRVMGILYINRRLAQLLFLFLSWLKPHSIFLSFCSRHTFSSCCETLRATSASYTGGRLCSLFLLPRRAALRCAWGRGSRRERLLIPFYFAQLCVFQSSSKRVPLCVWWQLGIHLTELERHRRSWSETQSFFLSSFAVSVVHLNVAKMKKNKTVSILITAICLVSVDTWLF